MSHKQPIIEFKKNNMLGSADVHFLSSTILLHENDMTDSLKYLTPFLHADDTEILASSNDCNMRPSQEGK